MRLRRESAGIMKDTGSVYLYSRAVWENKRHKGNAAWSNFNSTENYEPAIGLRETQVAIKVIQDFFRGSLRSTKFNARVCAAVRAA